MKNKFVGKLIEVEICLGFLLEKFEEVNVI